MAKHGVKQAWGQVFNFGSSCFQGYILNAADGSIVIIHRGLNDRFFDNAEVQLTFAERLQLAYAHVFDPP